VPIFAPAGIVSLFVDKPRASDPRFFVADIRIDVAAEMDEAIAADFDRSCNSRCDELLLPLVLAS
jgi:hypothetical protein